MLKFVVLFKSTLICSSCIYRSETRYVSRLLPLSDTLGNVSNWPSFFCRERHGNSRVPPTSGSSERTSSTQASRATMSLAGPGHASSKRPSRVTWHFSLIRERPLLGANVLITRHRRGADNGCVIRTSHLVRTDDCYLSFVIVIRKKKTSG